VLYSEARMMEPTNFAILGLGFVLGLKHAADADHIVAVTTFIGDEKRVLRACAIGLFWGFGHTLALSAAGLAVVGLKLPISGRLAARLEFAVAVMMVLLGARLLATMHSSWHRRHRPVDWRFGLRPLAVGLVHGAAGSAALTLLALSTISSPLDAVLYILLFGLGSIVGMAAVSLLIAVPFYMAQTHLAAALRPIQATAGILSCAVGVYLGVDAWSGV